MPTEHHIDIKSLEKFHLSFEHDKSWSDAKKAIKARISVE